MAAMQRLSATVSCGIALCFALSLPAPAGTVGGWWGGSWKCNIDGRPARMVWSAVNDDRSSCDGEVCTSSSGAKWKGRFSDNGSQWVALTGPSEGSQGGLFFRHADGNKWYLAKPVGNKTRGWTMWEGNRYPLSCSR